MVSGLQTKEGIPLDKLNTYFKWTFSDGTLTHTHTHLHTRCYSLAVPLTGDLCGPSGLSTWPVCQVVGALSAHSVLIVKMSGSGVCVCVFSDCVMELSIHLNRTEVTVSQVDDNQPTKDRYINRHWEFS